MATKKPKLPRMTMGQVLELTPDVLNKATKAELQHYVKTLANVANRRIKTLEEKELTDISPAYLSLMRGGRMGAGKFSYSDRKTKNQLRTELKRATYFLNNQTSLVKGTRQYNIRIRKELGFEATNKQINEALILYGKLRDERKGLWLSFNKAMRYKLMDAALETVLNNKNRDLTQEEIFNIRMDELRGKFREIQDEQAQFKDDFQKLIDRGRTRDEIIKGYKIKQPKRNN